MGIPAGFTPVEKQAYARTHDFREESLLQGKVIGFRNVPQKGRMVKVMEVQKSDGEIVSVWENSMLKKLFVQVAPKDEIFVEVQYSDDTGEGKQKITGYETAVKKAKK